MNQDKPNNVKILNIEEGIKKIDNRAFYCHNLIKEVHLPSTLETIGNTAFSGCINLEEITIPEGVTEIGFRAFADCKNLKRIKLPSTLKKIGWSAFSGCDGLESITLPNGLKDECLGEALFLNCKNLKTIELPNTITSLPKEFFKGCSKLDFKLNDNIKKLGSRVFEDCYKFSTFPTNVEYIGEYCFQNCRSIKEVKLNEAIINLEKGIFDGCINLHIITSPNKVLINSRCFRNCKMLEEIPDFIVIDRNCSRAFENCTGIKTIDIAKMFSDKQRAIDDVILPMGIFRGCSNLKNIYNMNLINDIEAYVFAGCCSLEEIDISKTNKVPAELFSHCKKLRKVKLSDETKTINAKAFYNCPNLTDIKLPDSIEMIDDEAFRGCTSIKRLYIPANLKKFGKQAFRNMDNLEYIEVSPNNHTYLTPDHKILINSNTQNLVLYAPGLKDESYSLKDYSYKIEALKRIVISPINGITRYAFADAKNLKELTICSCTKDIDVTAFYGCNNLKKLVIDAIDLYTCPGIDIRDNAEYYSDEASKNEIYLPFETVIFKGKPTLIHPEALKHFRNVRDIHFEINNSFGIGNLAFCDCKDVDEVDIPNNITAFGNQSFNKNTKLILHNGLNGDEVSEMRSSNQYNGDYKVFIMKDGSYYIEDQGKLIHITKDEIRSTCKYGEVISTNPELYYDFINDLKDRDLVVDELLNGNLINAFSHNNTIHLRKVFLDAINKNDKFFLTVLNNTGLFDDESFIYFIKLNNYKGINILLDYIEFFRTNNITNPIFYNKKILSNYSINDFKELINIDLDLAAKVLSNGNLLTDKNQQLLAQNILQSNLLNKYIVLIKKYNIKDKFLYQIPFISVAENPLFEKLLSVYDANIKRLLIASKALENESANTNLDDLLNILLITGALSEDEHTRQQSTTFLTEKIFTEKLDNGEKNKYYIAGDDIHSLFSFQYIDDYDSEFATFFRENYDKLIDEEKTTPGFVQRILTNFKQISETSTSNKGSQRKLKVTIDKAKKFIAENKFDGVDEENAELACFIGQWFDNNNVWLRTLRLQKEATLAPRNIFTKIEYDKDGKVIYDMNPDHDLKENISKNYSYEWLPKQDKDNLVLGKYCNCCAHVDGAGDGIMRASIILDNCQNLVIRNSEGKIIAKSTIYINKNEGYAVFNNVETSVNYRGYEDIKKIYNAFMRGAKAFITTYNKNNSENPINNISIGENRNTLLEYLTDKNNHPSISIQKSLKFGNYSLRGSSYNGDWHSKQRIVVKR